MVFGAGFLTSLTPCVYPMIPITVSIFGAREAKSKASAFFLATAYVMGIAVMYAGLGVLAALSGWMADGSGGLLTSPWFVIPLSLFFLALATSMFGLWEIRLPFWLQSRISTVGGKGLLGAFVMGLVGGILIAPCTGPVLAGILGYVATTRSVFVGGALLFTYALGIGILFWVLAMFAVSLPKSGAWMDTVKSILGIPLVVAALYYLQNIFIPLSLYSSGQMSFALLNGGFIVAGILLGGVHLTFHQGAFKAVRKLLGILLITVGLFGLINYALTPKTKLPWLHNEKQALNLARKQNKPLLIDFWAKTCTPCKIMEATVLSHATVRRELENFVLLKVDKDEDLDRGQPLTQKYHSTLLPEVILLDAKGKEVARAGKVETPEEMLKLLKKAR